MRISITGVVARVAPVTGGWIARRVDQSIECSGRKEISDVVAFIGGKPAATGQRPVEVIAAVAALGANAEINQCLRVLVDVIAHARRVSDRMAPRLAYSIDRASEMRLSDSRIDRGMMHVNAHLAAGRLDLGDQVARLRVAGDIGQVVDLGQPGHFAVETLTSDRRQP